MLVLFNDMIGNIETAFHVGDLGAEQVGVIVWDANDV